MSSKKAIFWFRNDLRLADNPALVAAAEYGEIIPVYILDDETAGQWKIGGASRWWLHHSLQSLSNDISKHHSGLIIRCGESQKILDELLEKTDASAIFWNRRYEPWGIEQDKTIKQTFKDRGLTVESSNGSLLFEPWEVSTKSGEYYKVFTPFWKQCRQLPPPSTPLAVPQFTKNDYSSLSESLDEILPLPTKPDWAGGLRDTWQTGEKAAQERLDEFLNNAIADYANGRDFPMRESTSCLSPYLHFGEISPRQIWHAVAHLQDEGSVSEKNASKFLAELGWREFSYNLLYHFPELPESPFRPEFSKFPWHENSEALERWQKGQTGYPIVDAGMRELWHTGIMHNRIRMVVASFLTKHLLLPWQEGAKWFWDTLVDADLASNSASWQWVAGCGADAAPYFRIFNPIIQGKKFDPDAGYIRKWVPEVAHLPDNLIYTPWEYDEPIKGYPSPLVDHDTARKRALTAYDEVKNA